MLTEPRSNDNLVGMSTPSGKILVYNFASSVKETRPLWKSWGGQKKKKELRLEHLAVSKKKKKKRCTQKKRMPETSLVVHWLRLSAPNVGRPGSVPGQGTRAHMPQLKILCAATKMAQLNKIFKKDVL